MIFRENIARTYSEVLCRDGVQFSSDLTGKAIVLTHSLLALHLGTNLLAAQVTQLVPVVRLKAHYMYVWKGVIVSTVSVILNSNSCVMDLDLILMGTELSGGFRRLLNPPLSSVQMHFPLVASNVLLCT